MNRSRGAENILTLSTTLPKRQGRRPITIRGPLHVQCSDNADDRALRRLLDEVMAWPDVEVGPLPVGSADVLALHVVGKADIGNASISLLGKEFGKVLFSAPTIYLRSPFPSAHWAIVRGGAEPHYCSVLDWAAHYLVVVYTPRDEYELVTCRALFSVSYHSFWNDIQQKNL